MKLGFYNFYRSNNQNRMFQDTSVGLGDDLSYPTVTLARRCKESGIGLATIDMEPLESFDAVVFLDYPGRWNSYFRQLRKSRRIPLYLMLIESAAVRPDNWDRANHADFEKIFVWDPTWVDDRKYIRYHIGNKLPPLTPYAPSTADKFCCMVASQKYSWAKEELYSERVRAIRWFEQHHPDEFDLFGPRWDRFYFQGKLSLANPVLARLYDLLPWLPRRRAFPSARGSVKSKRETMRQYKFSICYENAGYPGWITEKILDAMFAGCVPVYEGDPLVEQTIPAAAFIDKRNFADYDSLYRYMKGMSAAEYEGYRKAIHDYVHGEAVRAFSGEAFAELILRHATPRNS